jgi:hypothetical protein
MVKMGGGGRQAGLSRGEKNGLTDIRTVPGPVAVDANVIAVDTHHRVSAKRTIRAISLGNDQRQFDLVQRIDFIIVGHILKSSLIQIHISSTK